MSSNYQQQQQQQQQDVMFDNDPNSGNDGNDGNDGGGFVMGGNPGDGMIASYSSGTEPPETPGYSGYAMQTPANTPAVGSITQFATPPSQYSAGSYPPANNNMSSPYSFAPPPQPSPSPYASNMQSSGSAGSAGMQSNTSTGHMSYSQRAAMMHQQQQQRMQQQQPSQFQYNQQQQQYGQIQNQYGQQPQPNQYSQRPQQQQQQQQQSQYGQQPRQQQQPPPPPQTQQNQYGQSQMHQQQQQQQPPPQNQYGQGQNQSGMSYSQRSQAYQQQQSQNQQQFQQNSYQPTQANMYGSASMTSSVMSPQQQQQQPQYQQQQPPQQQPPQQQQQPQPSQYQSSSMMAGSYSQRSAAAYQSSGGTVVSQMTNNTMPMNAGMSGDMNYQQQHQQQQQQQHQMPPQQHLTPHQIQQQQKASAMAAAAVDPPAVVAQQQRLLTDATRKVQEHAYYMKQAMDRNDLPNILDRAAQMVSVLGEQSGHHHGSIPNAGSQGTTTTLNPKNYYELHLRALEDLPNLEDYLLNLAQQHPPVSPGMPMSPGMPPGMPMPSGMPTSPEMSPPQGAGSAYTMRELYDAVQYCPKVLPRLYLQICSASALIRSKEAAAKWVMKEMVEAVKCVQNPVRGLFLRHYLLQAFRDKLPDNPISPTQSEEPPSVAGASLDVQGTPIDQGPSTSANIDTASSIQEQGTVKDAYEFVLANFIEMNKLWVRIQHLPGDGKSKEIRRRRERERNELRILVGTNLVRLSQLEHVTSKIYGEIILPKILEHIVVCNDPLAQAYLMDCIVQVFPDEYHIETMPILLGVCPKLRDKVNIRTILQSLMDRLANYLADEELLDETDTNEVKMTLAADSYRMFEECVQNVYNARGPKLTSKEVIRLQTALLNFTMKCYQGNREQVSRCLGACVAALKQAGTNYNAVSDGGTVVVDVPPQPLDEISVTELEKLLKIPLDSLALEVLKLEHYSALIGFLPWNNRRELALSLLKAVAEKGATPESVGEIEQLFTVIEPVLKDEPISQPQAQGQQSMQQTTNMMAGMGINQQPVMSSYGGMSISGMADPRNLETETSLVSKLVNLLNHKDTDIVFQMLEVARTHLRAGSKARTNSSFAAVVYSSFRLAQRIIKDEFEPEATSKTEEEAKTEADETEAKTGGDENEDDAKATGEQKGESLESSPPENNGDDEPARDSVDQTATDESTEKKENETPEIPGDNEQATETAAAPQKEVSYRKVFVFIQQTISVLANGSPQLGIKLYLDAALTADRFAANGNEEAFAPIVYELITQTFALYESLSGNPQSQRQCIVALIGTLLSTQSLAKADYEKLVMKTAQFAAKMVKKSDQCEMVSLCSYLFYSVDEKGVVKYGNPQRCLECLQRALKLADSCTSANPTNLKLFVDLLDHYLYFFEKDNPSVSDKYISGLIALVKEHSDNLGEFAAHVADAKSHFHEVVRYIKRMKTKPEGKKFQGIQTDDIAV